MTWFGHLQDWPMAPIKESDRIIVNGAMKIRGMPKQI